MQRNGSQSRPVNPLKRPRQDPVSCQFCRSKKLKCDRQQPCSNCTTRGLTCDGKLGPQLKNSAVVADAENVSILARLKRLEDLVLGSPRPSTESAPSLHQHKANTTSPLTAGISPVSADSEYEEALHSLEDSGTRRDLWMPSGSKGMEIQILSSQQLLVSHGMSQSLSVKLPHFQLASRCVLLPPRHEAETLMHHYFEYIDTFQHVVYIPAVRFLMDTLYTRLDQGLPILVPSHVALLLSIFASSAALCTDYSGITALSHHPSASSRASLVWANAALELLEFSRKTEPGRLEDIQAMIIMVFFLYHIEGSSTRLRGMFIGAIALGRDLSLHKIDAPANALKQSDPIDTEIRRRLWWHVVAMDWQLALSGGPQGGTYSVQPQHMRVNMPRNVNDGDLIYENPSVDLPISEPTAMSYHLQRIKLASICRDTVDVISLCNFDPTTIDYREVIALDGKFEAFFEELPSFLKTDEKSRLETEHVMREYPQMKVQRYALGMVARARRCKLHQPFLIRRSIEGPYAHSRDISLRSARAVIRLHRLMEKEYNDDPVLATNVKLTGIIYHIFMATIVLVMDLCFNKTNDKDAARKAEVVEACTILEQATRQSNIAKDYLDSLMDVLRKHKVLLHNLPHEPAESAGGRMFDAAVDHHKVMDGNTGPDTQHSQTVWPPQDNAPDARSDFDQIWKDYVEYGPNMDMPQWDNLYSDLDSRVELY